MQQTDKPQLTYLISRVKQETVVPDLKLLEFRKQRFKERVNAMLHYAESLTSCRSMMLLELFWRNNKHAVAPATIAEK